VLGEPVKTIADRRERNAVAGVLAAEPASADTELDAAAAHLVHLGYRDRQGSR
jgi:hypothetical protein